jgi:glycosyltransferase involved in cell wall biosynthesis
MTTNKRIKIIHIITGLNTGGAERALYNLLASDFRSKYDCSVISLIDEGVYGIKIRALGIPVHVMNMRADFSIFRSIILFRAVIKKIAPDMLQGWMYHGNLAATLARYFCGGEVVLAWNVRHSLYELKSENFITRQIIKANRFWSGKADAIFYNSILSRFQHESFGFNSNHSILNPNGFDTNFLKPSLEKREAVRKELGISDDDTVIGHVARYHPMKDHASFIKAAIMVMSERSDIVVLMIGREVRANTTFLLSDLPETLISRFYFLGERSDVYDLMQAMDVFCLSSAWGEGFPNVLGEAMSMSVPCITTDIADSSEIVGKTGIVVPPCEPKKLADAIFTFLNLTSSKKAVLGRAARQRIEEKYLMRINVECYEAAYKELSKYSAAPKI